ncbi:UNVERIFIED_CONTAM: hypothetical protein RMT77_002726 [Armadillidium vulgare]
MNSRFCSTDLWFKTKKYERFWNVYNKCMIYAHQDVLSRCYETGNELAATLYGMVREPLPQTYSEFCETSKRIRRRKKKRKRKKKNNELKNAAPLPPPPPVEESVFVLTDDDTLQVKLQEQMKIEDIDIDDEYLTFMKTNLMHRLKWQQVKKEKLEEEEETYSDIEKREHPDVTREKNMKELYGDSAAQVHGMETALQLSFDRISTLYKPSIYPNIPVKLRFD